MGAFCDGRLAVGGRGVIGLLAERYVRPGLAVLPAGMDTRPARAMLLAIGLQESRFVHRRQIRGPARGWWQFETGGVHGVLDHPASRQHAQRVCDALGYADVERGALHAAIEHNDALACAFARLLLWRLPEPLPAAGDADDGWDQYLTTWRPGKPHRQTWDAFFDGAWESIR